MLPTVAGVPQVRATVTSAGVHNKAFFGLAVATSPATAVVLQNNLMPLHEDLPVVGAERTVDLPGVAAVVPAGQKLYLVVSPVSDMFAGNGSRTPGGIVLEDLLVGLPLVAQQADIAPAPGPVPADEDESDGGDTDGGTDGGKPKKNKKDKSDKEPGLR